MKSDAHLIFIKYPEPGKVKTRLAKTIGAEKAADIYKSLAEKTLRTTLSENWDTLIFIEPYHRLSDFREWLGSEHTYLPQKGFGLGERMFTALREGFDMGYKRCVLTGSDIPRLNADTVSDGLGGLIKKDASVGPASDGGYYLIGFRQNTLTERIFIDIEWSTGTVFEKTMAKLGSADLDVHLTAELSDLDDESDLAKLTGEELL